LCRYPKISESQYPTPKPTNFIFYFYNHECIFSLFCRECKVTFKLADFEDAQQVSVIGEFTEWTKRPIKMKKENGYWACEINLPKGENIYKFIVNDQYYADNKNHIHVGTGTQNIF
jgi:Glycogen recognition site of AMP-activated protein kinase